MQVFHDVSLSARSHNIVAHVSITPALQSRYQQDLSTCVPNFLRLPMIHTTKLYSSLHLITADSYNRKAFRKYVML